VKFNKRSLDKVLKAKRLKPVSTARGKQLRYEREHPSYEGLTVVVWSTLDKEDSEPIEGKQIKVILVVKEDEGEETFLHQESAINPTDKKWDKSLADRLSSVMTKTFLRDQWDEYEYLVEAKDAAEEIECPNCENPCQALRSKKYGVIIVCGLPKGECDGGHYMGAKKVRILLGAEKTYAARKKRNKAREEKRGEADPASLIEAPASWQLKGIHLVGKFLKKGRNKVADITGPGTYVCRKLLRANGFEGSTDSAGTYRWQRPAKGLTDPFAGLQDVIESAGIPCRDKPLAAAKKKKKKKTVAKKKVAKKKTKKKVSKKKKAARR